MGYPNTQIPSTDKKTKFQQFKLKLRKNQQLYLFVLPAFLVILIFSYGPMYGIIIAFKDYMPSLGILGSPWVGLKHFQRFFESYYFWDLIKNTLGISVYSLIVGFPLPIILALALNEIKDGPFKKITQTVTYAPNFIAVVVMVGMIIAFLSPSTGVINHLLEFVGLQRINFMTDPKWFKTCLLYTSDAADEEDSVDLGGRRIIKKKKQKKKKE